MRDFADPQGSSSQTLLRVHEFETHLPHSSADVWTWHTRPGAVTRLTPGSSWMRVIGEANNVRDGVTSFSLPAGLTWIARHDPEGFAEGHYFTDTCVSSPLRQLTGWTHRHTIADRGDGTTTVTDRITARVPQALMNRLAAYRRRQLTEDLAHLAFTKQWDAPARNIAVTGASGLVGTQLVAQLRTAGHRVIVLDRGTAGVSSLSRAVASRTSNIRHWDPVNPAPDLLEGVDAVVHLAGAPIFGRFSEAHIAAIRDSRVGPTRRLADLAARSGVATFVSASAVGFYGAQRPEPVDETATQGGGVLATIVGDWEADSEPARQAGVRVVNIRTGLVLAGGSPLLTLLAASSRIGGGRLGSGRQHFPWIGIDDLTDIYHRAVVDPEMSGPLNAVAPEDITEAEFADTLASVQRLRIPLRIPVPAIAPMALLGSSGAHELALADQHARPVALEQLGQPWRFAKVRDLLHHELG